MSVIAVDMTPVLPGGENGGAKIFTIELLKSFHSAAPYDKFLILTANWNHDELSCLDSFNMRRICVIRNRPPLRKMFRNFRLRKFETKLRNTHFFFKKIVQALPFHQKFLESYGVELFFCPLTAPNFFKKGIPLISIIYDLQHFDYPFLFSPEEFSARNYFYEELRCKANAIICISDYTRKKVIEYLNGIPDRCHTVHVNIHDRLSPADPNIAERHLRGLGIHQYPYLFYPANFWPHKNHRMLLTAYSLFLSRNRDLNLDLVFTGTLREMESRLKLDVKKMGLEKKVHFVGFISQDQLCSVWKGCEFLIFPSLYEGFGIPVLEAMALGKQVLCSNTTSLPEVAGNAALYFDPRKPEDIARCLDKIVRDQNLKNDLRSRGLKRASKFRKEDMVQNYLDIFRSALINPDKLACDTTGVL